MSDIPYGTLLEGSSDLFNEAYEEFDALPVDVDLSDQQPEPLRTTAKTIAKPVELRGAGTFFRKEIRHIQLEPCERGGWWIDRYDRPQSLPIKVSARNVWTTGDIVSNIVLRSGSVHNYMRLVEHIIALKYGADIDSIMIRSDSGDPPLFERGSLDFIEALDEAGRKTVDVPLKYFTVKETVSFVRDDGSFLTFAPCDPEKLGLRVDCAINFKNAIGRQRIVFPVNHDNFKHGAEARTNTNTKSILFSKTIGMLFADIRNLGYTRHNVLIAGGKSYLNQPKLLHEGKSLEAVWHRAVLDLLASIALIEEGRFLGRVTSYKAGHYQDVEMIRLLYANDMLRPVDVDGNKQKLENHNLESN